MATIAIAETSLITQSRNAAAKRLCERGFSEPTVLELIEKLWPKVTPVKKILLEGFQSYRVIISEDANLFGLLIGGDVNFELHLEGDVLQTISVIAACSAIVNVFKPKQRLVEIAPEVSFRAQIVAGTEITFHIRLDESKSNKFFDVFELRGENDQGQQLFKDSRFIKAFKAR